MSAFIPGPGTLFYAESRLTLQGSPRVRDRSYSEDILRCIAVDEHMLVFRVEYGLMKREEPRTLLLREWSLFPVSPQVAASLGLTEGEEATQIEEPYIGVSKVLNTLYPILQASKRLMGNIAVLSPASRNEAAEQIYLVLRDLCQELEAKRPRKEEESSGNVLF